MTSVIKIQAVSYFTSHTCLLNDISCEISSHQITMIIGPNGAGKTTLLKLMAADFDASSGMLLLGDRPVREIHNKSRAQCMGILPQLSLLSFPYRVEDVVALGRSPHRTGRLCDLHIVRDAMRKLDISHLVGRLYTDLSGGEKQRTQLARVMTQVWREEDGTPRILLLDEPLAALDLGHQQQLMAVLKDFSRQGVAVVMVSHDLNVVARYSDKIIALSEGKLIGQGAPSKMLNSSLLKTLFNADIDVIQHPVSNNMVVVS